MHAVTERVNKLTKLNYHDAKRLRLGDKPRICRPTILYRFSSCSFTQDPDMASNFTDADETIEGR